ncbi:BACON domain-containing protein [Ktedonobacter robiniae]|uniref:BACON domain-containing protein n=1 Tax=Ktedonobacter robiniae TaxID=2778365 RepID=UPI001915A8A8|nr:zinc ribbon domain-containing protein [Ktedonobacter robiniae]
MLISCPHCAAQLQEDAIFCPSCGGSVVPCEHICPEDQAQTIPLYEHLHPALRAVSSPFASLESDEAVTLQGSLQDAYHHVPRIQVQSEDEEQPGLSETSILVPESYASTWYKEVRNAIAHVESSVPPKLRTATRRSISPTLFFWFSCLVMVVLVAGGSFGVFSAFGAGPMRMTLQISPGTVTAGATLTLHGSHFSPGSQVGLSRDHGFPVVDTVGNAIIRADQQGNFTDTVVALSEWSQGWHTLRAEDAQTHTFATFSLLVKGKGGVLRPAHLHLSSEAFDFGTGDTITNGVKTLTLSNTGSGAINWQAKSDQDWLKISPARGTFISGQSIRLFIAIDRSHMQPGAYNGHVAFTSDAGNNGLTTRMRVVSSPFFSSGALSVSPPVLSFLAADGDSSPSPQDVTLLNAGIRSLNWSAASDASWLKADPATHTLVPGEHGNLRLSVDTHALLPGIYQAAVTLRGQDWDGQDVPGSPQKLFVSVTVTQGCLLQAAPTSLTFTGTYQGALPQAQSLKLGGTKGCSGPVNWSVKSDANWLHLDADQGTLPSTFQVSVDPSALVPGDYHATLFFSSPSGVQPLPVTLSLQAAVPVPSITLSRTRVSLTTIQGQATAVGQDVALANNGTGRLVWKATTSTSSGGSWLSVSPAAGSLNPGKSLALHISAQPAGTLGPGTYNGSLSIKSLDAVGHPVAGSERVLPVNLVIQPPATCDISVTPGTLSLSLPANQSTPVERSITLQEPASCAQPLAWQASATSGGNWLSVSKKSGGLDPGTSTILTVSASSISLSPGVYQGAVSLSSFDADTGTTTGAPHSITVRLNIVAPCSIQSAAPASLDLSPSITTAQFSLTVANTCQESITLIPGISYSNGSGWLSVTPQTVTVAPGASATFTVTLVDPTLSTGTYNATIQVTATQGGTAIVGGPQPVTVTVEVPAISTPGGTPTP